MADNEIKAEVERVPVTDYGGVTPGEDAAIVREIENNISILKKASSSTAQQWRAANRLRRLAGLTPDAPGPVARALGYKSNLNPVENYKLARIGEYYMSRAMIENPVDKSIIKPHRTPETVEESREEALSVLREKYDFNESGLPPTSEEEARAARVTAARKALEEHQGVRAKLMRVLSEAPKAPETPEEWAEYYGEK